MGVLHARVDLCADDLRRGRRKWASASPSPAQWGNYEGNWCYKSNECFPGVVPAIDTGIGEMGGPAANGDGRPVLFDRTQVGNSSANSDCFFWNGYTNSAADGAGCLAKRTTSSQILPAVPSNW